MKKGQKRRVWTKEQKLEIIGKHLNEHISVRTLEKEYERLSYKLNYKTPVQYRIEQGFE